MKKAIFTLSLILLTVWTGSPSDAVSDVPVELSAPAPEGPTELSAAIPAEPVAVNIPAPEKPVELSAPAPEEPVEASAPVPEGRFAVTAGGGDVGVYGILREDGALLVPLRAVSDALGAAEVLWDREGSSASVLAEGLSLYVPFDMPWMEANGRYFYNPAGVTVIEGVSYIPIEALSWAFGAEYLFDPASARMVIACAEERPASGEAFYGEEDLYWMSRIIYSEAGAESLRAMIAVGNVVMNRVKSELYPDTVREVVFDRKFGIQFTPAYTGAIYMEPSPESVIAAKIALEGTCIVGESLFFAADYIADTCWAGLNRPVTYTIGPIVFFG